MPTQNIIIIPKHIFPHRTHIVNVGIGKKYCLISVRFDVRRMGDMGTHNADKIRCLQNKQILRFISIHLYTYCCVAQKNV